MFKNYLKIALRNLARNKAFSIINILGLAIGMASAIMILLWIQNEVSYDQFHAKKDRIYEAWNRASFSGELQCWNTTPKVLARTLEKDIPEVEQAARINWGSNMLFAVGEKRLAVQGNMADSNFLQIFSFPLIHGDANAALNDMYSVVLTETLSKKLFGDENPMGKTIRVNNKDNFTVTGLMKDPPNNTRFKFEFLLPWAYLRHSGEDDENWGNNSTRTYVLMKPNASLASANEKLKTLKPKYDKEEPKWEMFLYPMSKWRLYSSFKGGFENGGRIEFVRMFGIIAVFILLIACINFMNLSTARSEKRAKEVGIRKVVGAQKRAIVSQFIGESILMALLAGIIAVGIVSLVLPGFNKLIGEKVAIEFDSYQQWIGALAFVVVTGLVAGSYPAFFLSAFKPVTVLKGTFKKPHALVTPRKVLVVLQFTFAIILIICTIIVKQQIDFAKDRQLGYNKHNLVYHFFTGDVEKNYDMIRSELLNKGVATTVIKTSSPLTQSWSDGWGQEWEGKDPNDKTDFYRYTEDGGLVQTAGLQLVMGRDIDLKQYPTDSTAMIINESALKVVKFKDPIGKRIKDNGDQYHIVGVFKDFIMTSPYEPTKPMLISGPKSKWLNTVLLRLNDKGSVTASLKTAEAIFKKYNPEYPAEFKFVDEEYEKKFEAENRIGTLAGIFAALTIFISCLGLFGLAAYMAENRIKEVGVRKVLGASVAGITTLLSKDFLKLVMVSFVIAAPIAWWAMHAWLQDYNYRTEINWWVFALAGLLSAIIAIVTVSSQAIRAAVANPVRSLRTE